MKKKNFNLNDLINISFSHWSQSYEKSCANCGENNILFKNELTMTKQIIIIHLILFSLQNGSLVKVPQKFNLGAVPTTKVLLAGQMYKVMNAKI